MFTGKDRFDYLNSTKEQKLETTNISKQFETDKILRKRIDFHLLFYLEEYINKKIH